ncbi:unnamed protein product, partial [Rotaria sp. Silwood2]
LFNIKKTTSTTYNSFIDEAQNKVLKLLEQMTRGNE